VTEQNLAIAESDAGGFQAVTECLLAYRPKKMALRPRSKSQHIWGRRQLAYQDLTLRGLACELPDN
jgi:hypothetical protein